MKTSVAFIGGLGNRLFQVAAGMMLQQLRGGDLEFYDNRTLSRWPAEELLKHGAHAENPGHFLGIPYVYQFGFANRMFWKVGRQPRRLAHRTHLVRHGVHAFREESGFSPMPDHVAGASQREIDLHGYFQHPTWFEPVLPEITGKMWSLFEPLVQHVEANRATAISVRLGDYVTFGADLHLSYYREALSELGSVDGPVWIVSQEPEAADLLAPVLNEFGLTAEPLPVVPASDLVRDLVVLSCARNIIMSNSTFCWWGVVTGQMQGGESARRIIVPNRWLPDAPGSELLIRSGWLPVEATFTREINAVQP